MEKEHDTLNAAANTLQDARWAAVLARDPQADGRFVYSVKTTGVYCRPSCPSRRPRPENIVFHASVEEAEGAGFRPCKRCQPNGASLQQEYAAKIRKVCRMIESSSEEPRLQQLANAAGMSVSHFHRLFRSILGLTPKQYAVACRDAAVRKRIAEAATVTEAVYSSGFNSSARFYATSNQVLGMTPTALRRGGASVPIHFAIGQSTLGSVLVAQSPRGICAISLGDDPEQLVHDLEKRFPRAVLTAGDEGFNQVVAMVVGLIETPGTDLGLPLDIRGTAFQQRVWQALQALPAGSTATYQSLANTIGMPRAVRAVAQACAANGIAVAIPCHRVIRTDGGVSGYRWGVERKRLLLEREAKSSKRAGL